ncbi:MAG: transcriptional repressor NrdR [Candidatus Nomurabacteria bacterium]|nr:MAG: transcriptional repressor NrdR [Candidatus Nomurabacteria bacterium]
MKCPVCHHADSKVTDSRLVTDGFAIRRRRECTRCTFRFTTYEEVELLNVTILKRDGRREPYLREKMEQGLRKALEKRPTTTEEFTQLLSRIERDIQKLSGRKSAQEVKSKDIGEVIMRHLKKIDPVAYIRFASVYRSFKDAETFQRELQALLRTKTVRRTVKKRRRS